MDAVLNDPAEFCRSNGKRGGRVQVADLARLSAICASRSGELEWAVSGRIGAPGHPQLDLAVSGKVDLSCQRCLESFPFEVDSKTSILLAGSEEAADEIEDSLAEDDPTEVIAAGAGLDLMVLVEDEVLLSIPLSPRHEVCPGAGVSEFGSKRESPFAVLKGLKTGKD